MIEESISLIYRVPEYDLDARDKSKVLWLPGYFAITKSEMVETFIRRENQLISANPRFSLDTYLHRAARGSSAENVRRLINRGALVTSSTFSWKHLWTLPSRTGIRISWNFFSAAAPTRFSFPQRISRP